MSDDFFKFYCENIKETSMCTSHFEGKNTLPNEFFVTQRIQCYGHIFPNFIE